MAKQEQVDLLKQGVPVWNAWRHEHLDVHPDLSDADLRGADLNHANLSRAYLFSANLSYANLSRVDLNHANLSGADLHGADLRQADLRDTNLRQADLSSADLRQADLRQADLRQANLRDANLRDANLSKTDLRDAGRGANLSGANLSGANLSGTNLSRTDLSGRNFSGMDLSRADLNGANLSGANLSGTNLSRANLRDANLSEAMLVRTNFAEAILTYCHIYGIAAWGVELKGARQNNLVITPDDEPTITVDNLKIAQFIYLLLNNAEIRNVIDTIASKVVLILGRFTPERKRVLDALRDELRKKDYLPIVFDFQKPANRDLTETVSTLAHMARFVIADITDPKSIPQELKTIVPNLPSVVIQPLLHARSKEYGMFEHFKSFPWVLETYRYTTVDDTMPCFVYW